jgi:peptidyl-prolyl cis-trans isomerase SurA
MNSKKWLPAIALLLFAATASSQTLFTYGNYAVSADEFLRAYKKNNSKPATDKSKSIRTYLDLYINSRLKIREAYERGYDTLPMIKKEVGDLRNQIIENYLTDPEVMEKLEKEAFQRSQKDIHIAHIFINAGPDTTASFKLAQEVNSRLLKKEDFGKLAQQYSQDPQAKLNKGDLGWITVFSLPYFFENSIYSLKPGQTSGIVRSKNGYHFFKNIAERKAVGKIKAKQILLAFPPGIDELSKKLIEQKADSLYRRIMAGEDFDALAKSYSNDYVTAITGGSMPDFGVGHYDPEFEKYVWALTRNGEVTKPFQTSHGYHIVKRISRIPVVSDPNNKEYASELRQRINSDRRWQASREVIYAKVVKEAPLQKTDYETRMLWELTDSIFFRKPVTKGNKLKKESLLFVLGDTSYRIKDWTNYAQAHLYKPDGSGATRPYPELFDEFTHTVVFDYYKSHLEDFNQEFKFQMSEFKDGNLFFEIMQNEIWAKANTDSAELMALYEKNKNSYNWKQSADAVIFFCSDEEVAKALHDRIKKTPTSWRTYADALAEKVAADSSRFEWSQIPNLNKMQPKTGMLTTPLVNKTDNTASFAYIIKVYPQPMARTFSEAKGLVINDHQAILEEEWTKELRKKYPVVVDAKVLESISR